MAGLVPYQHVHPFVRSGDWWTNLTPSHLFDQDFGMDFGARPYWLRPQRSSHSVDSQTGVSEVHNEADKFSVRLDVSHFKPEEITVKTVEHGLIISGKHEEKMDQHGFVSRTFTRRYLLPKDVDPVALTSSLTNDGVLYIEAPKKSLESPKERAIPIQLGAAHPAISHQNGSPVKKDAHEKKDKDTHEKKDKK